MGDSENHSFKIIEWNINCCKTLSKSKKWKKIANRIISTESPDILVLTECGTDFNKVNFPKLLDTNKPKWDIYYNDEKDLTHNYIAVLIRKNSSIKLATEINIPKESDFVTEMHPDRVAVEITFKDGTSIRVLGIRMRTSGLTLEQRILQNIQLVQDIQALKPDIIIGDFNTCSEMESLNIYNPATWKNKNIIYEGKGKERKLKQEFCEWDEWLNKLEQSKKTVLANFCNLINLNSQENKEYQYWPTEVSEAYSFCSKRTKKDADGQNIAKYTAPDTIIYSNKISLSAPKKDNYKSNPRYYPQIDNDQEKVETDGKQESDKPKINWPSNWPSDHCMLIADIEIKRKQ